MPALCDVYSLEIAGGGTSFPYRELLHGDRLLRALCSRDVFFPSVSISSFWDWEALCARGFAWVIYTEEDDYCVLVSGVVRCRFG